MACSRGKAHPNAQTKLRLFTDSGGFCQNQGCHNKLFVGDEKRIHIAEMAHIFAAQDDGPRANADLSEEERGHYDNIILLCANCHTMIDKDPVTFTDSVIREWKHSHSEKLNAAFGVKKFQSREELRSEVRKLLLENAEIHKEIGPDNDYRHNPEAAEADAWQKRVVSTIIPNSNAMIRHLEANEELLNESELAVLAQFKMHVRGLTMKHISGMDIVNIRFPAQFADIAG